MKFFRYIVIASLLIVSCGITPSNKVTLEVGIFTGSKWGVPSEDSYHIIDSAIRTFSAKHPNVTIHYYSGIRINEYSEWLSEAILQGKTPDIFFILSEDFDTLASLGVLQNLETMLSMDSDYNSRDFFSSALTSGQYNNQQMALPFEVNMQLMSVNKSLLNDFGFKTPTMDWTWQEFYDLCSATTKDIDGDGVLDVFGVCEYVWADAIYTNDIKIFTKDEKNTCLTDARFIEAIKFMQKLDSLNLKQSISQADFEKGKVLFMPISFAKYRTYTSYPYIASRDMDYKWDFLTMPKGSSGENVSILDSVLMGISSTGKHKQLAYDFLMTCTHNPTIQMEIYRYSQGASPLRAVSNAPESASILQEKIAFDDKQYDAVVISEILDKAITLPRFKKYDEVYAYLDNSINQIIDKKLNVESLLKTSHQKAIVMMQH